jgi:hypothetical protein
MQLQLPPSAIFGIILFALSFVHLIAAIIMGQIAAKKQGEHVGDYGWTIGCVVSAIGALVYGILFARFLYNLGESFFGHSCTI